MQKFFREKGLIVVAIIIALLSTVVYFQKAKLDKIKIELVLSKEKERILSNNIKVINEVAKKWKTKDGINVTTIGLLNADTKMFKTTYADLNKKFNNLILDKNKNVIRQTYLETQIHIKDNIIAKLNADKPNTSSSYIKNDSTIVINEEITVDARNFKKTTGYIEISIDSNKIRKANIDIKSVQGIGVDIALYQDSKGIDRVSVGTKYPDAQLSILGINDVEKKLKDYKTLLEAKNKRGRIGLGFNLGLGYGLNSGTIKPNITFGLGINWNIIRLK